MQTGHDRNIFLSTMPATSRDRTAALAVVAVSAVLFACAVPFAGVPLTPVPAFVASYQSALAINDLITAVLLFSQFAGFALAGPVAACERVFVHGRRCDHPRADLSRPVCALGTSRRRLANNGLALQVWHGGFPLFVLGYALLKDEGWRHKNTGLDREGDPGKRRRGDRCDDGVRLGRDRPSTTFCRRC